MAPTQLMSVKPRHPSWYVVNALLLVAAILAVGSVAMSQVVDADVVVTQVGADIDGEYRNDRSGSAVALSADGNRVAIGATENTGSGGPWGHVRVFDWDGARWVQAGADIDAEPGGGGFGSAVALSADGNRVAIGAPFGSSAQAGHVRVFDWDGTVWVQAGADIDGEAAATSPGRRWCCRLMGIGWRSAPPATTGPVTWRGMCVCSIGMAPVGSGRCRYRWRSRGRLLRVGGGVVG